MIYKKYLNTLVNTEYILQLLEIYQLHKSLNDGVSPISYIYSSSILKSFKVADHKRIQSLSYKLIKKNKSVGYFYLAKSLMLENKLEESKCALSHLLKKSPYHPESHYLLTELEYLSGEDKILSWQRLTDLLKHSKRRKTWQVLSNLVSNNTEFLIFYELLLDYFPDYQNKPLSYDLICHISNAAMRAKNSDFALSLWRNQYSLSLNKDVSTTFRKRKQYSDESASLALKKLKECLDKEGVEFFLISGTLLGCIREGKLLGHDKDIDIGVWEDISVERLSQIIRDTNCFYILPNYSNDILVIRHMNGITIDIFIHYRDRDNYFHRGGKSQWNNSPFELSKYNFLDDLYNIPKDFDLYLTENYGNWRVPLIDFDSALDTPNMKIFDKTAMIIYLYKRLFCLEHKDSTRVKRYKEKLVELGENIRDIL